MRPRRLELEGFTAFRNRTVVDFADAELFALTGPTGAGKSSLIDAMVFALYGSVPRHGKRSVAPVVTQGSLQARVLLDFTVGSTEYTVARVVRKDARGSANTDEARLEAGGQVVASGAQEVDERVAELMGLDYDQFTTCVVLPQGEFERFLHAKPADRQGLLVALLDLGIYERVAQLATGRHRHAEGRRAELDSVLETLSAVDETDRNQAEARVGALSRLLERIDEVTPRIEEMESRGRECASQHEEASARVDRLAALRRPSGFEDVAARIEQARSAERTAKAAIEEARSMALAAEQGLDGRSVAAVQASIERRRALADAQSRVGTLAAALEKAERARLEAEERHRRAVEELEDRRRHDLAAHLRSGLRVGDACPVCRRPIEQPVEAEAGGPLEEREKRAEAAGGESKQAGDEAASVRALLEDAEHRVAGLLEGLAETPGLDRLEQELVEVSEAEKALGKARRAVGDAERAEAGAARAVAALSDEERNARRHLQQARDSVAALEPPVLDLEDLARDWDQLIGWAEETLPAERTRASEIGAEVEELRAAHRRLDEELRQGAVELGIDTAGSRVRDAVVQELSAESARLDRLKAQLEQVRELVGERRAVDERVTVARELALHLRANNFEKWLLDEALRVLAAGANQRLAELARGQYSLALSSKLDFEIIDHHAADEHRSVRSLSGGETFLVSLSLALSLADHIAEMASGGAARLESIFLDEGFGTLDPETLETVASVISEIGASGKTVGLVTHVKELAEQVPVRFEVKKGAGGATVERVEA